METNLGSCLNRAVFTGDEELISCVIQHLSGIKPALLPCSDINPLAHAITRGKIHLLAPMLNITSLKKK